MSELAALVAQLTSPNPQPAQDPALAAVKLARTSIDALVLKLGQSIDAKVVGQLVAGLTQLTAGSESFVLKLETPLPAGTAVTIKVAQTPQGHPAVTVSVPTSAPHVAQPMPLPASTAPLMQAQAAPPTTVATQQPSPQATQIPLPEPDAPPPTTPGVPASPRPSATPYTQPIARQALPQPAQQPTTAVTQPAPPAANVLGTPTPQPQTAPSQQPTVAPVPQGAPPPATQAPSLTQAPGPPASPITPQGLPLGIATVPVQPAATPAPPQPLPQPAPPPGVVPATLPVTPPPVAQPAVAAAPPLVLPTTAPQPALPPTTLAAQPQQPLPTHPSPYPVRVPQAPTPAGVQPTTLPASPQPTAARSVAPPPLNLADPAQAAARQDSAAPLLARLATIVTATLPSMPRPVIEMALLLLANRVDLNRAPPDAKTLEAAVLKAGVLLTPPSRERPTDSKSGLLALRSALLAFLGGDTAPPVATAERPAPPIKGEPPRAPTPQASVPDLPADSHDTARTLLGQTDAALSRLKLLQSASQPADIRTDTPAPRNELRVEIPMLLGAETGILQLMVERDARHKREPERQRGWRMRFAMNFSATGEVGADIALLGHSASVAIWAADPETADALDALLPELAPAIQRHGLELTSLRVRRGAPQHARTAPGQLLDSAR